MCPTFNFALLMGKSIPCYVEGNIQVVISLFVFNHNDLLFQNANLQCVLGVMKWV